MWFCETEHEHPIHEGKYYVARKPEYLIALTGEAHEFDGVRPKGYDAAFRKKTCMAT